MAAQGKQGSIWKEKTMSSSSSPRHTRKPNQTSSASKTKYVPKSQKNINSSQAVKHRPGIVLLGSKSAPVNNSSTSSMRYADIVKGSTPLLPKTEETLIKRISDDKELFLPSDFPAISAEKTNRNRVKRINKEEMNHHTSGNHDQLVQENFNNELKIENQVDDEKEEINIDEKIKNVEEEQSVQEVNDHQNEDETEMEMETEESCNKKEEEYYGHNDDQEQEQKHLNENETEEFVIVPDHHHNEEETETKTEEFVVVHHHNKDETEEFVVVVDHHHNEDEAEMKMETEESCNKKEQEYSGHDDDKEQQQQQHLNEDETEESYNQKEEKTEIDESCNQTEDQEQPLQYEIVEESEEKFLKPTEILKLMNEQTGGKEVAAVPLIRQVIRCTNNINNSNRAAVKKEAATSAYNEVIEETASKLIAEEKRNKVLALVGAFETVISLENEGINE